MTYMQFCSVCGEPRAAHRIRDALCPPSILVQYPSYPTEGTAESRLAEFRRLVEAYWAQAAGSHFVQRLEINGG